MPDFDEYELAVLNAIDLTDGVDGRDFFRGDTPHYREAFDRLAAKKYIVPHTAYHLAPDIKEALFPDASSE